MTRAKFVVQSVKQHIPWADKKPATVELSAVSGDSKENKEFFASTPSGHIEFTVYGDVGETFKPGQEFYVDFTPVAAPADETAS